jgi:hypothetical protein
MSGTTRAASTRPRSQPRSGGTSAPRLALTRAEAANAIGMSLNSFERHVQPELRIVRRGRMRLIPVAELDRWLERNAARAVEP